jgi:hypothetical protein
MSGPPEGGPPPEPTGPPRPLLNGQVAGEVPALSTEAAITALGQHDQLFHRQVPGQHYRQRLQQLPTPPQHLPPATSGLRPMHLVQTASWQLTDPCIMYQTF